MRTLHLLFLPLVASCGIDLDRDDNNSDEPATSEHEQDVDGWSTSLDDTNAQLNGVAISSTTTHAIVVAGSHGLNWTINRSTSGNSSSWTQPDTFNLGDGGQANAVAVAPNSGVFYAVGSSFDASGKLHAIVRRSTNEGVTWSTVFDVMGSHGAEAFGVTVASDGTAFVSGYVADSSERAVVWRGKGSGTWGEVHSYFAPITGNFVALYGMCTGTYHNLPAVYAVGNANQGVPSGNHTVIHVTTDGGSTWSVPFDHVFRATSVGTGCSQGAGNDMWFSGYASDSSGSAFEVIKVDQSDFSWGETGVTSASQNNRAQGVLHLNTRTYSFGTIWGDTGNWRVRFRTDGDTASTDSENWHKTGATNSVAIANGAAWTSATALYVVGAATDSTGKLHGMVRRRDSL